MAGIVLLDDTFQSCAGEQTNDHTSTDHGLEALSSLMANYARPSPDVLRDLSARYSSGDQFRHCCLSAITSADNPFVPGMVLSTRLAEAAEQAPEGEQRTLSDIQKSVDELLLEIFERLPQTVRAFPGGMLACTAIFYPGFERQGGEWEDFRGPLDLMFSKAEQRRTFCNLPLVMDFLSRRFTLGLPDLRDTSRTLRRYKELEHLGGGGAGGESVCLLLGKNKTGYGHRGCRGQMQQEKIDEVGANGTRLHSTLFGTGSIAASLMSPRALLQGANCHVPSLTLLPGVQFSVAGLVAKPDEFYKVPVMRLILDVVVFLAMITALSVFVLFNASTDKAKLVDGEAGEEVVFRESGLRELTTVALFVLVRGHKAEVAAGIVPRWFVSTSFRTKAVPDVRLRIKGLVVQVQPTRTLIRKLSR